MFKCWAIVGALFVTGAGVLWAFGALNTRSVRSPWVLAVFTAAPLALTLFAAIRAAGLAKWKFDPIPETQARELARLGRRAGVGLFLVCAVEGILIGAAASTLGHLGREPLAPVVFAAIVGLHLVPIGRLFGLIDYEVTGWLIAACAAASLLLGDVGSRNYTLGIAVAVLLWTGAARILAIHSSPHFAGAGPMKG